MKKRGLVLSNAFIPALERRIVLTDVLVLSLVYLLPAASHIVPLPLYYLDPMRLLFLLGLVLSTNRPNTFLLAITIPLFSTIATGHPTFFKSTLISFELVINFVLMIQLLRIKSMPVPMVFLLSIVGSKVIYYTAKYLYIRAGIIDGALVTTSLWIQLFSVLLAAGVMSLLYKKYLSGTYPR